MERHRWASRPYRPSPLREGGGSRVGVGPQARRQWQALRPIPGARGLLA
jgi:hypothetical protein